MSQLIGSSSNKKPCDINGCCVDCHVDLDNGNNRTYPCYRCTYATKLKTQFNHLIDDLVCEYSNGEFQMYINSFPSNMCIFEKFEMVVQFLQVAYKAGIQPKNPPKSCWGLFVTGPVEISPLLKQGDENGEMCRIWNLRDLIRKRMIYLLTEEFERMTIAKLHKKPSMDLLDEMKDEILKLKEEMDFY
ncbi:hypothetical protein ACJIZ3_025264 [Penstemon smallii]|uniref:Uncharacterized protein n=1 Tax=Penstemon smallii TaxID=265156 RepID=A0ABD3TWP2_9LAMI